MYRAAFIVLGLILGAQGVMADELEVICFFPDRINFEEVNKTCKKGDLIRTRPSLAEMVCDWDKQIFKYTEDDQEWVTCVYHGSPRALKVSQSGSSAR